MIYQAPELKFIMLDQADVIATSGLTDGGANGTSVSYSFGDLKSQLGAIQAQQENN